MKIDPKLLPLVGEYAWHSVTVDPRISDVSRAHYTLVRQVLDASFPGRPLSGLKILEVACYAHTTGYDLARDLGCDVTLFELSAATLRLGRSLAAPDGPRPTLVIGDFHELPFEDASFDFVFICSALHHTLDFPRVARELMRVVRPGGIVFLENEPCLRQACFYKFRCNREGGFTPLEQHLWNEGWLRTFAEPYVGSRPETLFGMIENQRMPLPELLGLFRESGCIENLEVFPEICMGPREHEWFSARLEQVDALAQRVQRDLTSAVKTAQPHIGPVETGLGFTLPGDDEIASVARQVASRLATLDGDPTGPEFRCNLAEIFGAAVRLTIRRSATTADTNATSRLRTNFQEPDGIYNGFPPQTQKLLGQRSRLPDLQVDGAELIASSFPASDWSNSRNQQGVVSLTPYRTHAPILLPGLDADAVFILRVYCGLGSQGFYELRLRSGSTCIAVIKIYHAESRLLIAAIPRGTTELTMELGVLDGDALLQQPPPLAMAYAGLFSLQPDLAL